MLPSFESDDERKKLNAVLKESIGSIIKLQNQAEDNGKTWSVPYFPAEGVNTPLPKALIERLSGSYTRHIALEEAELLPLSAHLLNPQQIMELGKSMAERRGAKFPSAPTA